MVLSVILWVLVSSDETTSQLVKVEVVVKAPPGLALARSTPEVRALVTGTGRELIKLYGTPPVIRAFVPSTAQPPHWRLDATPATIELPPGVRVVIQDVEPRFVEIAIDRLVNRMIPVALRGVVEPESGFVLTSLALAPTVVRVSGPQALVQSLDSLPTELFEVRGVTGRFERAVPLDTVGRALLAIVPREVTLTGGARRTR